MEEEKKYGLALPETAYPVFKEASVSANKYGEIIIDGVAVHIPKSYHYNQLHLITYWDQYKAVSPNGEILSKGPRPYMNQERDIPWHDILASWKNKPRSIVYSRYFPYLPGRIAHYLNIDSMKLRKERVRWLISLLPKYGLKEIDALFYELAPKEPTEALQGQSDHPYDVNWALYDSLQPMTNHVSKEELKDV